MAKRDNPFAKSAERSQQKKVKEMSLLIKSDKESQSSSDTTETAVIKEVSSAPSASLNADQVTASEAEEEKIHTTKRDRLKMALEEAEKDTRTNPIADAVRRAKQAARESEGALVPLTVRLPAKEKRILEQFCYTNNITMTGVIRMFIQSLEKDLG